MKLQPHHLIAASFLAAAGYLVFDSFKNLERLDHKGLGSICLMVLFSSVPVLVMVSIVVMALRQRWEEFVKVVAFLVMLVVIGLLAPQINQLNKTIESSAIDHTSYLYVMWCLCVTAAPFVICIVAYKRLVPLILRRIARAQATSP